MPMPAKQAKLFATRLAALRKQLAKLKLDAFIVPRNDEHQGEYVAAYADRLKWLTGFTGSWGTAIVGTRKAAIFVDGRYTVQVTQEVDTKLFTPRHLMQQPPHSWITAEFGKGQRIGFDPWITSIAEARKLEAACKATGASLVAVDANPVDSIWTDQPPRPATPIFLHPKRFAGEEAAAKLKALGQILSDSKSDAVVLADPSSVAWSLNVRASDVPYTPVPLAFAIVHKSGKAQLFASPSRFEGAAKASLKGIATAIQPEGIARALKALGQARKTVSLDPAAVPEFIRATLAKAGAKLMDAADPCLVPKATKNATEQKGARQAQIRDGAALCEFLCWLDEAAATQKMTELHAEEKLHAFRKETGKLHDLSFRSISAAGANAALPHYHVSKGQGATLRSGQIYLIDSGGQYADGTTDVTRTIIIGVPTAEMKDRFTRVLKGMIAVSIAHFPESTTGAHLDALARSSLWKAGLDFDHGTGHGVGSFLSVHEGPARISKTGHAPLRPGMILSNEPGYYKLGKFGIRIENLLLVKAAQKVKSGDRSMLSFETLTLAPIDRRLIETSLLTREELMWIDDYHSRVLKTLQDIVQTKAADWLKAACAPIR